MSTQLGSRSAKNMVYRKLYRDGYVSDNILHISCHEECYYTHKYSWNNRCFFVCDTCNALLRILGPNYDAELGLGFEDFVICFTLGRNQLLTEARFLLIAVDKDKTKVIQRVRSSYVVPLARLAITKKITVVTAKYILWCVFLAPLFREKADYCLRRLSLELETIVYETVSVMNARIEM